MKSFDITGVKSPRKKHFVVGHIYREPHRKLSPFDIEEKSK